MNGFDILILLLILWSTIRGWCSGLFIELCGIAGVLIGVWVSFYFGQAIGVWLSLTELPKFWLVVIITIGVLIAVSILCRVLTKILEFGGFGGWVRLLGALAGCAKCIVYASLSVLFINQVSLLAISKQFFGLEYLRASQAFPILENLSSYIFPYISHLGELL